MDQKQESRNALHVFATAVNGYHEKKKKEIFGKIRMEKYK